jgi:glycosyltransferase involved in cell wall biosynthesis
MAVFHTSNRGAAAARNAGLALADGRYVALYDADDLAHPTLMARQVQALDDRPELDLVFALYRYVDGSGAVLGEQAMPNTDRLGMADLLADNIVHAPLFRGEILVDTGTMDTALSAHIDLDFFLRVAARRERCIGVIPEPLSDYRRHGAQITSDWRRMRQNHATVLAKHEAAGLRLSRADQRRIQGRLMLYWATLAYEAGEYASARRLILSSLGASPRALLRDPHGRVRMAACATSLLPPALHDGIRRWFNGRATT